MSKAFYYLMETTKVEDRMKRLQISEKDNGFKSLTIKV